jgi:hypothetical protein
LHGFDCALIASIKPLVARHEPIKKIWACTHHKNKEGDSGGDHSQGGRKGKTPAQSAYGAQPKAFMHINASDGGARVHRWTVGLHLAGRLNRCGIYVRAALQCRGYFRQHPLFQAFSHVWRHRMLWQMPPEEIS